MKTTTEVEIKVSGARVTNATVMTDGTCKLTIEAANAVSNVTEVKDNVFVLVEASKLSLNDEFMQYEPETDEERKFKLLLEKAIKSGLKDFKRPNCDPSFNEGGICYEYGKAPAVGKSYNWWNQVAKKFKPEYNSRLGTKTEYVAFLGVLIKQLVEMGCSIKKAWDAVCNNSLESNGCRAIFGIYDLVNCYRILAEDEEAGGFWIAGCDYYNVFKFIPLAELHHCLDRNMDNSDGVGWLVLD